MLELKYKSQRIGEMMAADCLKWTKALLIKIHVITGWVIPDNELLNVLIDQFQKKLNEDYPDMNPDEIEYAFRQYGTQTEDWGKGMNLNLIDKILIPYRNERFEVSLKEEAKTLPEPKPDLEKIEREFQEFLDNPNVPEELKKRFRNGNG